MPLPAAVAAAATMPATAAAAKTAAAASTGSKKSGDTTAGPSQRGGMRVPLEAGSKAGGLLRDRLAAPMGPGLGYRVVTAFPSVRLACCAPLGAMSSFSTFSQCCSRSMASRKNKHVAGSVWLFFWPAGGALWEQHCGRVASVPSPASPDAEGWHLAHPVGKGVPSRLWLCGRS